MASQALQERITPFVPFELVVENADNSVLKINFKLAFDFNAFAMVEEITGLSMLTDIGVFFDKPKATTISVLFWAAVQRYHDEYEGAIGLKALRSMLTLATSKNALIALAEAFLSQLPAEQAAKMRARAEQLKGAANAGTAPLAQEQGIQEASA